MRVTTCSCCQSFSPKQAEFGPHLAEQPRDDGRHATEMAGTRRTFPAARRDRRRRSSSRHPAGTSSPRRAARPDRSRRPRASPGPRLVARVARQVLVRAELQRIDEDRGGDCRIFRRGAASSATCPSCSAPIVGTSASARAAGAQVGAGGVQARAACGRSAWATLAASRRRPNNRAAGPGRRREFSHITGVRNPWARRAACFNRRSMATAATGDQAADGKAAAKAWLKAESRQGRKAALAGGGCRPRRHGLRRSARPTASPSCSAPR